MALFFFSFQLGWFPLRGAFDTTITSGFTPQFLGSVLTHLLLPAATIILVSIGGWMLGMRNAMIGTLAEDYITVAEAKGVPRRQVMLRYAARNAILPTVTSFGMALGFVISGALKGAHKVHGKWPGLAPEQLNEGRDLALTTDFRSVFSEVASKHLGAQSLDKIFPGFRAPTSHWVGVL